MKNKKIGVVVIVAVIAVTASWNLISNVTNNNLSDLVLKNVEALAGCEPINLGTCWYSHATEGCCESGDIGCGLCD